MPAFTLENGLFRALPFGRCIPFCVPCKNGAQNGNDNPESNLGAEVRNSAMPASRRQENPQPSIPRDGMGPARVLQWVGGFEFNRLCRFHFVGYTCRRCPKRRRVVDEIVRRPPNPEGAISRVSTPNTNPRRDGLR